MIIYLYTFQDVFFVALSGGSVLDQRHLSRGEIDLYFVRMDRGGKRGFRRLRSQNWICLKMTE